MCLRACVCVSVWVYVHPCRNLWGFFLLLFLLIKHNESRSELSLRVCMCARVCFTVFLITTAPLDNTVKRKHVQAVTSTSTMFKLHSLFKRLAHPVLGDQLHFASFLL